MIKVTKHTRDNLLEIAKTKKVYLEGNILKLITSDDDEFNKYIQTCINRDKESRRKRLAVTKEVQLKNKELETALKELNKSKEDAVRLKEEAVHAKEIAEEDLTLLQQKTQTELMGNIVRVALFVIVGVGIITTLMYMVAIIMDTETQVIGSTWSNLTGILLTNAFSIVGTIMGVKHIASNDKKN
jgi:Fe2+ transport system protein B|tara:strand:- start:2081 stop:2635 length:555 start_codon:yes stop_codon:yes gene_type:complete